MAMCMFLGFIRIEMFKQHKIISLISSIIGLNLPEFRILGYLLLTSQLFNSVELNLPISSTKNSLLLFRLFGLLFFYKILCHMVSQKFNLVILFIFSSSNVSTSNSTTFNPLKQFSIKNVSMFTQMQDYAKLVHN